MFMSSATLTRLLAEDGDITQLVPLSKPAPVPTPVPPKPPTPPPPAPPAPPNPSGPVGAIEQWYSAAKAWWDHHFGEKEEA
jgi:hypothetical protein